ncbi:MAG TPA: hypothetical protein VN628_15595 [Vicinamibacterales bacterium]|nr:hypothetical protein [Vicinamibacterales bacterium]
MDRPQALHTHAADNLQFIREAMSRAGQFTAIPGWGGVIMGASAIATAAAASRIADPSAWLASWFGDAAFAVVVAAVTMSRKARRLELPMFAAPARRFAFAYLPPLASGGVLTAVFVGNGLSARLPGCWLLLYGASIAVAGTLSIRIVQVMGVLFMALGAASFIAPPQYGDAFMAAGFGGLHIVFGLIIARKHGG